MTMFGPFGPMQLTEEQKAELQRQRDLHMMAQEESVRATNELLDSLSADQLDTLKGMMVATMDDEKNSYATHMMGWINSMLYHKFEICLACGKKHELDPDDAKDKPDGE